MRMHVLGKRDLVVGFRLAGVRGDAVESPEQAIAAMDKVAADPEVAVIVVSSTVARHAKEQVERVRVRQGYPIVIEIAEPADAAKDPEALMRFVGEAVGLRL